MNLRYFLFYDMNIGFQNHSLTYTFKILEPKIVMHAREHLNINALSCMKIFLRFMNKLKFELVSL